MSEIDDVSRLLSEVVKNYTRSSIGLTESFLSELETTFGILTRSKNTDSCQVSTLSYGSIKDRLENLN